MIAVEHVVCILDFVSWIFNHNSMGRFKKGLFLGGLLGAAFVWLNTTPKGKETRDEMLDHAVVVYGELKSELMRSDAWKQLQKSEYVEKARALVDTYAVQNGLADHVKTAVLKLVELQWKQMQDEMKK